MYRSRHNLGGYLPMLACAVRVHHSLATSKGEWERQHKTVKRAARFIVV